MKPQLTLLISTAEIVATVQRLAQELDSDYQQRTPVMIGLLKGAFVFLADLIRHMHTPLRSVEFLRLSSYGDATMSVGHATISMGLAPEAVTNQHVIIVEDIVDTGITTDTALQYVQRYEPASLKLCTLLDKPARRQVPVTIDYLGHTVPDRFIVGYGIDFAQQYRQLPAIYTLEVT